MRKSRIRKPPHNTVGATARRTQETLDLETAEPDVMRNLVSQALSQLAEVERRTVSNRLLTLLKHTGVRIGQCLLLLGIPARTVHELTAPEVATLIRYVRINEPKAMAAIVPVIREILTLHSDLARGAKVAGRAA